MFEQLACKLANWTGRPAMLFIALLLSANGLAAFAFGSELYLNGSNIFISIVTLLLLPILQASQNRDGAALQAKLDELLKAVPDARDEMIEVEKQGQKEIEHRRLHVHPEAGDKG